MQNVRVGAGAQVHRAIIDKNMVIPPGATIGINKEEDLARGFTVTDSGLTVAPKNFKFED